MVNDIEYYQKKFISTQNYLETDSIQKIVSIKYREDTNNSDYQQLINDLRSNYPALIFNQVKGNFYGNGWLVIDNDLNRTLLIEHETGLEILYIAGSIASLLQLIQVINSGWKVVRNKFREFRYPHDKGARIEIRVINSDNKLIEQNYFTVEDYINSEILLNFNKLEERIGQLELEINDLKKEKVNKKTIRNKKSNN